ncbi:MAG: CaiB/BaiF CoA-transferase family protein [Desulfomonilaceae bacterium]|nr:CaiB/BaiF CoA-transferase family protein [Desulfomonilaceae bacterium]
MSKALDGLTVLDLSMNLPGPYMTWFLTQLGAEVVKVENPDGGDYARALGGDTSSPFFAAVNRNKKSVAVNLKHPEGRRILLDLLDKYDILVEGFRPGTMERLGLGFETTSARNPRLIHVSITGYGHDSPYRDRAGHDVNYLSLAGIIGMTGSRDGRPGIPGIQVADLAGGSFLALTGLLAAIVQREATGRGQFVDAAMFDGALSLATMVFAGVDAGLEVPEPGKMLLNGRFPCYGLYQTKDGLYMSLGALEFKFWRNFCSAVGREDLQGKQFGGPEVTAELQRIFAERTRDEWTEQMKTADACCEPVLSLAEAVGSPLTAARGMIRCMDQGRRFLGFPLKMSDSSISEDEPAPELGEHTREILTRLGMTDDEIEALRLQKVIL